MESLAGDDPVEIGGYRMGGRLGAGGMGRVYLAFTEGGRPVALKVIRPELGDDPDFRHRFRQEIDGRAAGAWPLYRAGARRQSGRHAASGW